MSNKPIRAFREFTSNIKGLPYNPDQPGTNLYMTETGYSQSYPWKVVSVSASGKTMKLMPVKTKRDPEWKPEMHPGGFAAHCSNQGEQTWLYDGIDRDVEITVRLKKSPYCGSDRMWGDANGRKFIANGARCFYDYNF